MGSLYHQARMLILQLRIVCEDHMLLLDESCMEVCALAAEPVE